MSRPRPSRRAPPPDRPRRHRPRAGRNCRPAAARNCCASSAGCSTERIDQAAGEGVTDEPLLTPHRRPQDPRPPPRPAGHRLRPPIDPPPGRRPPRVGRPAVPTPPPGRRPRLGRRPGPGHRRRPGDQRPVRSTTAPASSVCSPRSRSAGSASSSGARSAGCRGRTRTGTSCWNCAPCSGGSDAGSRIGKKMVEKAAVSPAVAGYAVRLREEVGGWGLPGTSSVAAAAAAPEVTAPAGAAAPF